MKTRKLKRLGITAVLAVLMMSFAITAMAAVSPLAQDVFMHTVSTTSTSSGKYCSMHAGPILIEGHLFIVNTGVDAEYYTAKAGNVSDRMAADGVTHYKNGRISSTGRKFLGMNRTVSGTKISGYIKATNNYDA
ncbi:MAG: hypothetical protein V8Q43_02785 [Christensenellaceae bacterium]